MKVPQEFAQIAPYLREPLVLVGFGLLLTFGLYRLLVRADVVPAIRLMLLRHVFTIGLLLICLGFGLQFWRDYRFETARIAARAGLEAQIRDACLRRSPAALVECTRLGKEQSTLIDKALQALIASRLDKRRIESALARAKEGKADELEALLKEAENREAAKGPAANPEVAKFVRLRGALTVLRSAREFVAAFRRSVELDPANPEGWRGLGFGLVLTGDPAGAESAYRKAIELDKDRESLAESHAQLGMLLLARGDLTQAEAMQQKALEGFEAAGDRGGMAGVYLSRGMVSVLRGDVDRGEALLHKALAFNEDPGAQAPVYVLLGSLYRARGNLAQAEAMARKSLDLFEARGFQMGMAASYGLLASVLDARGDAEQAEAMERKALAINEALDFKIGMATSYERLGVRHQNRGELDRAEAMYRAALHIAETAGVKMVAGVVHNYLGSMSRLRGDFDRAEASHRKARDIFETQGLRTPMALPYEGLGLVFRDRGDLDRAETLYRKALATHEGLGHKYEVAVDYASLGQVHQARGELDQAEALYRKALILFQEMKAVPKIAMAQGLLKSVPKQR